MVINKYYKLRGFKFVALQLNYVNKKTLEGEELFMKNQKFATVLVLVFVFVMVFTGCGKTSTNSPNSGTSTDIKGPKEITVLSVLAPDMMPQVLTNFQNKYGVKVNYTDIAIPDLHSKLATIFAAKSSEVDVIWTYSAWTAEFGNAGFLKPLTDKVSKELMDDLIPGALESVQYKNVLYGVPRFLSMRSFFYNKQMYKDAGLDPEKPPETWAEFKNDLTKLTKDTNGDGKADQFGFLACYGSNNNACLAYEIILYLLDGEMFNDKDEVLFNNDIGLQALTNLVELHKEGLVDPASLGISSGTDQVNRFVSGVVATTFGWANTYKIANDPAKSKMIGQLGYGLIPKIADKTASLGGSEGYAISKFSKAEDASLKFLEYVASKEEQKGITLRTGWMPVRFSVFNDQEVQQGVPLSKVVAEQAKFRADRFAAPYAQEVIDALGPQIIEAVTGAKTPKEALDQAAVKAKEIVAKYK